MNRIKEAYTAQELAPLLGKTERGIRFIAAAIIGPVASVPVEATDFEYPTIKLPPTYRERSRLAVSPPRNGKASGRP